MYKLSIIVPVYGVEKYLHGCLDSIYSQITPECQVILVDDESPDRCGEICEEYKSKYPEQTIVIHQKNMGLGGARNSGIECATGEYLFFIDSDDSITERAIPAVLSAIDKFASDVIVFPFILTDESGNELGRVKDSSPVFTPLNTNTHPEVLVGYPNAWNKVVKAEIFRKNDIRFPLRVWYEDLRTSPKLFCKADSIVYIDEYLYNYLQREGSIMNSAKVERNIEIIEALEDLIAWFKKEGLYEQYKTELDYLLIDHVLVAATVRVIRAAGTSHHLIKQLRDFTFNNCASLNDNKYVNTYMPKNRKLIYKLLKKKMYFAVKLIFKIKK